MRVTARLLPLTVLLLLTSTRTAASLTVVSFLSRARRATCSPGDCKNGGVCNTFTASPPCICPLPYIPPYCSAAANYCNTLQPEKGITSLPVCQNGGNCTMVYTDPYFNCTCPSAFTGIRCNETGTTVAMTTTTVPSTVSVTTIDPTTATPASAINLTTATSASATVTPGNGTATSSVNATETSGTIALSQTGVIIGAVFGCLLAVGTLGVLGIVIYRYFKRKINRVGCSGSNTGGSQDQLDCDTQHKHRSTYANSSRSDAPETQAETQPESPPEPHWLRPHWGSEP